MGEREKVLDHLHNDYTEPVRDPVWKHISLSRPLLRVAEHAQFQKLDRIRQLGPAYLVYPGATHTRRSHSLGVFHVARRMMTSLSRRGDGRAHHAGRREIVPLRLPPARHRPLSLCPFPEGPRRGGP